MGGAQQHEAAAADAAQPRLDHADRERRGDRGVDRVAAVAQDARAGLRGEPMLRGDHAARARSTGRFETTQAGYACGARSHHPGFFLSW